MNAATAPGYAVEATHWHPVLLSEALPRGASVIPLNRAGGASTSITNHIYPQSHDVEAIARRVAFLIGSGRVQVKAGMV